MRKSKTRSNRFSATQTGFTKGKSGKREMKNCVARIVKITIRFVKDLCSTPVGTMIRSFLLVLCLIYLLFLIKPNVAHIYADLELNDPDALFFSAENVEVSEIGEKLFTMDCPGEIKLSLDSARINGKAYALGDWLLLKPTTLSSATVTVMEFHGQIDSAKLYNASNEDVRGHHPRHSIAATAATLNCTGKQIVRFFGSAAIVHADNSQEVVQLGETFEIEPPTSKLENEPYSFVLYTVDRSIEFVFGFPNYNALSSDDVHSVETNAYGSMKLSITPDPKDYEIHAQDVVFHQEAKDEGDKLSFRVNYDDKKLIVFGYTDKAMISRMNLFPDFKNWFFSNVYLAPITVISTVLSATALFQKQKKKKTTDSE